MKYTIIIQITICLIKFTILINMFTKYINFSPKFPKFFSNPNMGQGIFSRTFYVLQEPINVQSVNVRLNIVQTGLVDNILYTEQMQCLRHELGGIANGLIYHKDH